MATALHEARASQPHHPHGGVIDEKAPSDTPSTQVFSHTSTAHGRRRSSWRRDNMPSFRHCLSAMLVIAFITMVCAAAPATPKPWRFSMDVPADEPSFQDLLSSVSDDALHEVLHDVSDKYKHGAYPQDRAAIEAIHKDSPAMAKGLVELARRQKSNGTTVTAVVTPTTSVVVVVPTTSVVIVSPPVRPSDPVGSQTTTTQAANSPPPPQTSNPTTPGTAGPQDTVTQTTIPVITVTSAAVATSTADVPSPSGITTSTTAKPPSTTKEIVFITTMPNGSPSTVTSFTIVAASDQATPGVANPSVSVTPSLQNGATYGRGPRGMGIAGAFIAALVFVVGVL